MLRNHDGQDRVGGKDGSVLLGEEDEWGEESSDLREGFDGRAGN